MTQENPLAWMPVFAVFVIFIGSPANSWAQAGPEEIIVTARKKEESLQEVPISITAFTADTLRESGATNNYDVALLTVNFNTLQQNGRRQDRPVIRGQSAPANRGEPNASYFIDGAYVSGSISTASLGPIERVEILRGPQSAQFGRATFSGAVNYITRRPTDIWEGEIQTRAGSYDKYLISGWTSGPLIEDKLLFFGSVAWDKYGGGEFHNNLAENAAKDSIKFSDPNQSADYSRLNRTETRDIMGKLLWQINDSAELTLKASYTNSSDGHYAQLLVEQEELNCYPNNDGDFLAYCGVVDTDKIHTLDPGNPLNAQERQARLNIPDMETGMTGVLANAGFTRPEDVASYISQGETVGAQRDQYRFLADYRQDISDWQMTVRAAANNDELEQAFDLDGRESRPFAGLFAFYQEQDIKDHSLEVRFDSPGDSKLRGSIGAYYFNSAWRSTQHSNVGVAQAQMSAPKKIDTINYALFGALDYDFNDYWSVGAEARVAEDKKKMSASMYCLEDAGLARGDATAINPNWDPAFTQYIDPDNEIRHEISARALTPRFSLRYQLNNDVMFYWQAAKGNKPADFNNPYYGDNREGCQTQVDFHETGLATAEEETAWTYEIGTKTSWLDNRIIANASFFYINWENQGVFEVKDISLYVQEFINSGLDTGIDFILASGYQSIADTIINNAGKSEVYGLEFESSYFVNDKFQFNLSYGLVVGEYKEYNDPFLAEITGGDGDASGNRIPDTPKHSVVLGGTFTQPVGTFADWFLRSDIIYETERETGAANLTQIEDRTFWNARTGLQEEKWEVNLYINNILDEASAASILQFVNFEVQQSDGLFPASYAITPLPGRNYGIEAIFRFGG